MKYFSVLFISIFLTFSTGYTQDKISKHVVAKGETIKQIAQQYKVTPSDIYKLNPDAQSGLKPNSVLLIPKSTGKPETKQPAKTNVKPFYHVVVAKETLYGIENRYNISDEALKKANPNLEKEGLEIGQTLIIPSNNSSKTSDVIVDKKDVIVNKNKVINHEVLPKETKFSIAKKYGITIEELEKRNPEIISNLPIGYNLIISGNAPKSAKPVTAVTVVKKESSKPVAVAVPKTIDYVDYTVKAKETLYSLSKLFGMSQAELIVLNPALSAGVEEGMILKAPSTILIAQEPKKETVALTKKNSSGKKTLVMLLPFNMTKVEGDTVNSTVMRLKKDKFLNMTLDFYSGVLVAIDSAKQLGLSFDVKILDSQETKNTSNVAALIQENNLESADAIIGPFYQSNVEKTAVLLAKNNVPVISPLSKDVGTSYENLYQTIVSASVLKTAMFDFMRAKGGNVIAVVDKKKETIRKYIQENQKDIQFAALTETGGLSVVSLKSLLVKDRTNYVLLETANTGMIKATINAMLSVMATYKVQLVILEQNETLETDEINFESLTKLNLMYPSATRENDSPAGILFKQSYREKNKVNPSAFATRGFDVTFDTMMRLSQDKTYQETVDTMVTEQVDNKFEYYKKGDAGYANKGVYILYYDTDLTIKEAE